MLTTDRTLMDWLAAETSGRHHFTVAVPASLRVTRMRHQGFTVLELG